MATAPRYEAAAAYVGCDGTADSARAIASKYSEKAAMHLCAFYSQATLGRCQSPKAPQGDDFDIHLFKRWKKLGGMLPITAKQLFVRILEIIDPEWIVKARDSAVGPIIEAEDNINVPESSDKSYVLRKGELKAAQDVWLGRYWYPELEISDRASERTLEDSRRKEIRDCVQLAIDDYRKLGTGAIQRKKEKVNLVPATNSSIPSVKDILTPNPSSNNGQLGNRAFMEMGGICLVDDCDCWTTPSVYGQMPKPRYQHGAFALDYQMCIAGGSNDGNWYDDIQVLDLMSFTWSKVDAGAEKSTLSLPAAPCSGQPLIVWNDRLFAIAGRMLDTKYITVNELNTRSRTWRKVPTEGTIPIFRFGQSATIVGNNLVIFGGENASGVVLNDLHILNLETMIWVDPDAIGTAPPPRSDHAAACYEDKYVFIFGGQCHNNYYNDLYKFDLGKSEWTRLDPEGVIPAPRAGHAGVTIDANWIIVGGRDRQTRFSETFVLNMRKSIWSFLATRLPATEGMSLVRSSYDGDDFIISFGGYDGNYINEGSWSSEVRVLRLSSTYDQCQSDPWPLDLSDDESDDLESKRKEELEAWVSKRLEEREALFSKRKEELEGLVSKRKELLAALEREELARNDALTKKVEKDIEESAIFNAKADKNIAEREELARNDALIKKVEKLIEENASFNAKAEKNRADCEELMKNYNELVKKVDKLIQEKTTHNAEAEKNKMEDERKQEVKDEKKRKYAEVGGRYGG